MSASGSRVKNNNQITFTFTVAGNDASLAVSPNAVSGFGYAEGDGPSAVKSIAVIGVDLSGDITVTAPTDYEISDAENGTYGSTVTLTAGGRGGRETLTYDFEDGTTQGWTVGSDDNGSTTWAVGQSGYNPSGSSGTVYTTNSGNYYVGSVYDASNAVDDWLISPQITLGGNMVFYIKITNTSYTDYYSVHLSTGTNAIGQFATALLPATQVTSTDYTMVTVDLSAYTGQGYVAIRHTADADQASLLVDDVTIVEGGDTPVNPTNPTTDLLAANVYVRLKGGLGQGIYNETLSVTTGDVTSNVGLNGEVYPTLAAGWNWWTPTKAMTLGQLEEALGGNAVLINTQGDGFARYENGQWSGTLTEIAAGQMYKIEATSSVSLTMSGSPATGVSLTILPGYNWFGYTGSQSKTIAAAFSGFAPTNGDTVTDKTGNTATYNNGWSGSLTTLEPGHGYVYHSKATQSRTLTF